MTLGAKSLLTSSGVRRGLGWRDAAGDDLLERAQIAGLVAAVAVETRAARQPAPRHAERLLGQCEHVGVADRGTEAALRHLVAQVLASGVVLIFNYVGSRFFVFK